MAQTSLRMLISAFVIRLLERIISKLATSEISIVYLVPVAKGTDLSLVPSQTDPKDKFCRVEAHLCSGLVTKNLDIDGCKDRNADQPV